MKILTVVDPETLERLVSAAETENIECITTDPFQAIENRTVAGMVVGLDYLSLRLVAACDGHDIPLVVLVPEGRSTEALSAFGIRHGLPMGATWAHIFAELNVLVEDVAPPDAPLEPEDTSFSAQIVAVWGPTGAPGRSVVSLNIAAELAVAGQRVALIDADTHGGSIAGFLELFDEAPGFLSVSRLAQQGAFNHGELTRLSHIYRVEKSSFTVLSGMVNSRRWPELSPARIRSALEELRSLFDVLVIDVGFNLEHDEEIVSDLVGPRRNQATLEILRQATTVVAVCSADVIGVARFIHALDGLRDSAPHADLRIVANRGRAERSANATAVKHTLSRFAGLDDVDVIPDEPATFHRALDVAAPLLVVSPKSPARSAIANLARAVVAKEPVAG